MNNPALNKELNESIRVLNERLRQQLVALEHFLLRWDADYAAIISELSDAEIIEDGRADTPQRTVGELRQWLAAMRAIHEVARYRSAADNIALQTAVNNVMAGTDVVMALVKFTVRVGAF